MWFGMRVGYGEYLWCAHCDMGHGSDKDGRAMEVGQDAADVLMYINGIYTGKLSRYRDEYVM